MYKTKTNENGQIELWWEGQTARSLLGVYDTMEELELARSRVKKQEERNQFLSHTLKDGKRRKVELKEPQRELSDRPGISAVIISDDILQVGGLEVQEIDLLISLGDLIEATLLRAIEVYQPARVLAVRGNHDEIQPLPEPIIDLHLRIEEIKGVRFGGFSGSWKYKDQGAFLYEQAAVSRLLDNFPPVDIFIAHNSPWGIHEQDKDIHQGFIAFRKYIERVQPRYFFHGHQHLDQTTQMGETEVVGVYGERAVELEI